MNSSHFAGLRPQVMLTLLASAAITLTGCSNVASTTATAGPVGAVKFTGKIHGGNQPVAGATVNLYFAGNGSGNTGFHSAAKLVATTTSSSDGFGSFSFNDFTLTQGGTAAPNDGSSSTFSCTSDNNYVFVVAKGGTTVNTTGAASNGDAEFIAPLGPCTTIDSSTQVVMSEVVTVATMAAIHQYMDPSAIATATPTIESTLGSDGIFVSGQSLIDAFSGVANLANLTTGLGNTSITRTGLGVTMTITPETAKLNQLANILSDCINQTTTGSTACQTIYTNAVAPANISSTSAFGSSFPAATDLLTALYYIFANPTNGSTTAMQNLYNLSAASGAPYQPTLSAIPTDWSLGVSYASTGTCTTSGLAFINNPAEIIVGVRGNIFFTNSAASGSQVEMSTNGVPVACAAVNNASGGVYDSAGNTWVANNSANTISRYSQLLASATTFATPTGVISIAADGYGDIFFSGNDGNLYELSNGATATATALPIKINSLPIGSATHLTVDPSNRVWASSNANFVTATQGTPTPTPTTGVSATTLVFDPTTSTTSLATASPSGGLAATSSNRAGIYSASASGNSIQAQGGNVNAFTATGPNGGLSVPVAIALDGVGNVWSANGGSNSNISAFDVNGNPLTPSTGFVKDASFLGSQSAITIDPSGNVWVGLANSVTEIVGAAVPVYGPYATGLAPGTVRYGQIP